MFQLRLSRISTQGLRAVLCTAWLLISAPFFTQASADRPTLTVYTYDSFAAQWGPGPKIKAAFEKQCQCELKFVSLADGVAILNRLRMEGKNSKADVALGLDNNLIGAAEQTGLFTASQTDLSQLTVPNGWHNTTFIPYDYGYFAFIYDKTRLATPPTSLKQLVESPAAWKIIYQDPRTSTPGLGLLLWMENVYGDKAGDAWQQLAKKTVTVTKGWSEAYGLFLKGEADMVLSYTTSPSYHIIEEHKTQYAAANFSEGHYLQVEVAAQLKNSAQPQLAQQFMQFIITPGFQQAIPQGNWMYPVIDMPLPEAFQRNIPQKTLQYSAEDVTKQRSHWIQVWQSAVSH